MYCYSQSVLTDEYDVYILFINTPAAADIVLKEVGVVELKIKISSSLCYTMSPLL